MIDISSNDFSHSLDFITLTGFAVLIFLFYHFFNHKLLSGGLIRKIIPGMQPQSVGVLSAKISGIIWLGLLPVLVFGILYPLMPLTWLCLSASKELIFWLAVLLPIPVIMASFTSRSSTHRAQYPQVREPVWSRRLLFANILCWILYLAGYEAFFRGFLLFGLIEVVSPWTAIMINTLFYSLVHIPKGAGEAFGAIPLGILLCLITLTTGNFWVAFLVHCSMACANDLFSLRNHTEIISPLNRNRQ